MHTEPVADVSADLEAFTVLFYSFIRVAIYKIVVLGTSVLLSFSEMEVINSFVKSIFLIS